jgi:hypothetical protein
MQDNLKEGAIYWMPHHLEKNPNRKWWQVWKSKYIWVDNKETYDPVRIDN